MLDEEHYVILMKKYGKNKNTANMPVIFEDAQVDVFIYGGNNL